MALAATRRSTTTVVSRRPSWHVAAAAVIAVAAVSVGDSLLAAPGSISELPGVVVLSLADHLELFAPFLVIEALLVAAWLLIADRPAWARLNTLFAVASALACAAMSYRTLIAYPPFFGYLPFIVAWSAVAAFLAGAYVAVARESSRRARLVVASIALAGAVSVGWVNITMFADEYAQLHRALSTVVFLLVQAGCAALLGVRGNERLSVRAVALPALAIAAAALASLLVSERAITAYRTFTVLGRSTVLSDHWSEVCGAPALALDDLRAREVFDAASGMPPLPASFRPADYNVLIVTIEALRYDESSLGNPAPVTPQLARLVDAGAFAFHDNMSASSGTFLAIASLFSMTHPSHSAVTTQVPGWHGRLREEAQTVSELYRAAGFSTFAAMHAAVPMVTRGFEQGFDQSWVSPMPKFDVDVRLADWTIATLERERVAGRRFFGWMFLLSPHSPYQERVGPGTARERYRQEIAHADAQLGRVVDHLRATGLLDTTIIIVVGDHGEEFGDHGRAYHKATLYREVLHTPLVIRVPGIIGGAVRTTTSTTSVFPWLLRSDPGAMGAAARRRIGEDLAPMLQRTGGAVIAELIGWDRMKAALIWKDRKIVVDLISGRREIFDRTLDPKERRDLSQVADDRTRTLNDVAETYRAQRACRVHATVTRELFKQPVSPVQGAR